MGPWIAYRKEVTQDGSWSWQKDQPCDELAVALSQFLLADPLGRGGGLRIEFTYMA